MSDTQVLAAIAALRAEMVGVAAQLRSEIANLRGEVTGKLDFVCEQLNRAAAASPPAGVQRVAQPVADQVEGQHD